MLFFFFNVPDYSFTLKAEPVSKTLFFIFVLFYKKKKEKVKENQTENDQQNERESTQQPATSNETMNAPGFYYMHFDIHKGKNNIKKETREL